MPCRSDPQPPPESAAAAPAAECPSAYGATVELIGGSHPGIDKWLGGELAADGCIYGVPGSAKCVLKVDPRTDEVTRLGDLRGLSAIRGGKFKWLRGALDPETGDTFGVPSNGNQVLRIDRAGGIDLLGNPDALQGHWKWHGGVRAANGSLYCCPCNADRVLKIAPASGEVSLVGGPWPGKQKWYGSLLGKDGCMYNVPNCASAVLKFDPASETGTLLGNLPGGGWKWHGAAVGGDGCIYGVPAHARRVLKIVVGSDEVREIGMLLPDTKYKWGGACTAANGDVVCFPSDTGRTLRICCAPGVPEDEQVSLIGPSYPGGNKWQNGFLGRDGAIYGLPCNAPAVLRISPSFEVTTLRLSGGDSCGASPEKWEGGAIAPSGVIYAMPQQADRVLRIDPGARAA